MPSIQSKIVQSASGGGCFTFSSFFGAAILRRKLVNGVAIESLRGFFDADVEREIRATRFLGCAGVVAFEFAAAAVVVAAVVVAAAAVVVAAAAVVVAAAAVAAGAASGADAGVDGGLSQMEPPCHSIVLQIISPNLNFNL